MPTPFARGFLVVVDGIDGAGKTTQVEALRQSFSAAGEAPLVSKEPTDGPWGQKIRDSALKGRMSLDDELAAFIEDRAEHVSGKVLPALSAGKIVILDRYYYSTIAYQGCRGADVQEIELAMEERFPVPDLTVILDIDPSVSLFRIHHSRKDIPNEFERAEGLTKARSIFRTLRGDHVHIVDGSMSMPAVHATVLRLVIDGPLHAKRCKKRYGCENSFECTYRLTGDCEWFQMARALNEPLQESAVR
jgi:dTMP kinase